ncbi:MAG TPA: TonB-dependent receptor [Steroidobacteraceae bacterium]|nr:TonB-dependent receptor [Steroidobacteraceae bacterium]
MKRSARNGAASGLAVGVSTVLSFGAVQAAQEDTQREESRLEEVIVTGSLITDPNRESPSPILISSIESLQQSGTATIEAALNQLPMFAPAGAAGNGGQGTGGHATVNLHALGANRNLVLLDGRRLPLADIFGTVDINLVPDSILSSVQTITGGASAVYGSDAMSGVVNFISLDHFEGATFDAQYGNTEQGDLAQTKASLALGSTFSEGGGHALLSVGYTDRGNLLGKDRMPFFDLLTPSSFIGQGTFVPSATNLPNQTAVNDLFTSYGATTPVANSLNLGFNDDGSLFTQTGAKNYKGPTTDDYRIISGNVRMPVQKGFYVQNPLERKSVFSKFDYELGPVTTYGQVLYVDSTVTTNSGNSLTQFGNLTTIPVTNPFIPNDLRNLLATRPTPGAPFTWNGRYVGVPFKSWDEQYTTTQYLGGVRGSLPFEDWTWDVFAAYDTTEHVQTNHNAVLKSQVQNLLNAPDGGNSICAGGFNPFGLNHSSVISAACLSYMTTTAHSTEDLSQTTYQGVVQGPLFNLPAGPVKVALLVDHRKNTYEYQPDSQLASQNIEAVIASKGTRGEISVDEYAAQIDVPLLADIPLIHKLNIGGAFRRSDYTTSGSVDSYEGDLRWEPIDSLLIRGGYQRAVRAPNIGELFAAASGAQIAFGTPPAAIGDPCDIRSTARTGANGASVRGLCLAQGIPGAVIDTYVFPTTATAGVTQGNPDLQPETADTYNFGLAWTSRSSSQWLGGLSASVDYYSIEIKDVISVVPGLSALSKCYNLDGSNPGYDVNNQFCQLLTRDANGLLQLIETPYLNLGGLKTEGVDLQLDWQVELNDRWTAHFNTAVGYLLDYSVQTLPGSAFQDFTGTNTIAANHTVSNSFPEWKALTTVGIGFGPLSTSVRWRWQDAMEDVTSVTTPATPGKGVATYNLFDFFASYDFNTNWQMRFGVTNLTDEGPVTVSSSQTGTDTAVFDVLGRSYYMGVRVRM